MDRKRYSDTLTELLELSGVPLDEKLKNPMDFPERDSEEQEEEPELAPKATRHPHKKSGEETMEPEDEEPEDEKKPEDEEEIADTWDVQIKTGSKLKFEMYENYLYVWYRGKRSDRMEISSKLRPQRKQMASLFNKILTYVEKVS